MDLSTSAITYTLHRVYNVHLSHSLQQVRLNIRFIQKKMSPMNVGKDWTLARGIRLMSASFLAYDNIDI